ncbi:hypothetical protein FRACYDRAFT_234675 [Fragilariopsis cylindrus CCMP1102]|uniref:Fe2OG dioxygenase domain-containing protein n=1 Tax=Fragilariopsis cylindrus CCMP1102 TaxID=635003 RepID=A0A1E7FSG1_9STRA|nr:hypothetical protein FRACYDRAFT_234675 [Fragilariopsis cylindrus CCMP1102]|eukprot:OEU21047.1 hypothetical protein FRACYDRAFT_234675 [Fragilariopsis cylindrus CCMP1102]
MQQQYYQYGCTCAREPFPVKYYTNRSGDSDGEDDSTLSCNDNDSKVLLIENLRIYGWSPIVISNVPNPSPSKDLILSIFRRRRQRQQQRQRQRQHSQQCNNNDNDENAKNKNNNDAEEDDDDSDDDVVFISAESGSSDGKVEPKESLEIELSKCYCSSTTTTTTTNTYDDYDTINDDNEDDDDDEHTIKTWCKTLSWIANEIICNEILDVPKNSFLSKDPNESLDLLRIFHYYQNDSSSNKIRNDYNNKQQKQKQTENEIDTDELIQLGSSEHTDWGSLTIVWQDNVGGLQTYCRACNKWINVRAVASTSISTSAVETTVDDQDDDVGKGNNHYETTSTNQWTCIVHVGDMTSLMLDYRHSLTKCNSSTDRSSNNISSVKQDDTVPSSSSSSSFFSWPSPLHRVISPKNEERVSLVYFGYPPRGLSLNEIQNNMLNGWNLSLRGRRQPLDDYYLLRNQSVVNRDDG